MIGADLVVGRMENGAPQVSPELRAQATNMFAFHSVRVGCKGCAGPHMETCGWLDAVWCAYLSWVQPHGVLLTV